MDLLVVFNPGFLWHACPGEFSTCDSEGGPGPGWSQPVYGDQMLCGLILLRWFSLLVRASQDCDMPWSSGLRIRSASPGITFPVGQGWGCLSSLHPNPYPWFTREPWTDCLVRHFDAVTVEWSPFLENVIDIFLQYHDVPGLYGVSKNQTWLSHWTITEPRSFCGFKMTANSFLPSLWEVWSNFYPLESGLVFVTFLISRRQRKWYSGTSKPRWKETLWSFGYLFLEPGHCVVRQPKSSQWRGPCGLESWPTPGWQSSFGSQVRAS